MMAERPCHPTSQWYATAPEARSYRLLVPFAVTVGGAWTGSESAPVY